MDRTIWVRARAVVRGLDAGPGGGRYAFRDADIVLTLLWAVLHGKPVSWACRPQNWPVWERRVRRPPPSRLSRRLRTAGVARLLGAAGAQRTRAPGGPPAPALGRQAKHVARHP